MSFGNFGRFSFGEYQGHGNLSFVSDATYSSDSICVTLFFREGIVISSGYRVVGVGASNDCVDNRRVTRIPRFRAFRGERSIFLLRPPVRSLAEVSDSV